VSRGSVVEVDTGRVVVVVVDGRVVVVVAVRMVVDVVVAVVEEVEDDDVGLDVVVVTSNVTRLPPTATTLPVEALVASGWRNDG
jgi:hypothetical protein